MSACRAHGTHLTRRQLSVPAIITVNNSTLRCEQGELTGTC